MSLSSELSDAHFWKRPSLWQWRMVHFPPELVWNIFAAGSISGYSCFCLSSVRCVWCDKMGRVKKWNELLSISVELEGVMCNVSKELWCHLRYVVSTVNRQLWIVIVNVCEVRLCERSLSCRMNVRMRNDKTWHLGWYRYLLRSWKCKSRCDTQQNCITDSVKTCLTFNINVKQNLHYNRISHIAKGPRWKLAQYITTKMLTLLYSLEFVHNSKHIRKVKNVTAEISQQMYSIRTWIHYNLLF